MGPKDEEDSVALKLITQLAKTVGLRGWSCLNDYDSHVKTFSAYTEELFEFAQETLKYHRFFGDMYHASPHTSWMCECFQEEKHDVSMQGGAEASYNPETQLTL